MTLQRITLTITVALLLCHSVFAQQIQTNILDTNGDASMLISESHRYIKENGTKITIRSNAPDAAVFLNGQFEGNTTLTIKDLPEGHYFLRVEKPGYAPKRYRIAVRREMEETFYVELEKYEGTVTFKTNPEDTQILVDGSTISTRTATLSEGEHTVTARKFGYKEQSEKIYVYHKTYQEVSFELKEAAFELSSFKASKKSFNPALPRSTGQIKFSFRVTAKETGVLTITDQSGKEVLSYPLPEFSTWVQEVTWNGTDNNGHKIQDGTYTATVTAADQKMTAYFDADSSIHIPSATITASGTGTGNLPQAFRFPQNALLLSLNTGFDLTDKSEKDNIFYCAPVTASISYTPLSFIELSGRCGLLAGYEGASPFFNAAVKFSFTEKLSSVNLDWGFLLRTGGSQNHPFEPYGADNGSGSGGGLVFGIDHTDFYAGLSTELTYGTSSYAGEKCDTVWRNGLAFQVKREAFSTALYGALCSSFGTTLLPLDDRTDSSKEWFRAIEAGTDICIQPSSLFTINLRGNVLFLSNKKYFRAETGITVLL